MSNKLMSDTPVESPPGAVRPRWRRTWIISGFVLWGLVFAAVLGVVLLRKRERASDDLPRPAALVLTDSGTAGTSAARQISPLPPWNAAGVEDFSFTERSGRKVTKADLLGHPWLISFIFTRCAGPCPRVSAQMSELQAVLKGTDVRLVTLTVDPDFDTTSVLSRYAEAYGADSNRWLYLTGDKHKTYRLINNSFLMPVQEYTGKDREPGFEVMHSTNILLVNENGVVVQKYNALDEEDMSRLRHDLKPYLKRKGTEAEGQGTQQVPAKPTMDQRPERSP